MGARGVGLMVFFALSLANLEAEEPSPWAVEIGSGLVWGSAGELVLDPASNRRESDPVSLLTWPVPPAYELTLKAGLDWTPWLTTSVAMRGAWPLRTATMTDEDWRTPTDGDFLVYGRSQSETYLTSHWSAVLDLGFRWGGATVGGGGLYKSTVWEAWNGTSHYEYSSGVTEAEFSGLVLEYRQVWYIPFVSAQWTGELQGWTLSPSVRFSPYTWCFDTDNHMLAAKRVTYLDNLRGGWYAEARWELTFPRSWGFTGGLRGSWETARGAVGETYAISPTSSTLGTVIPVSPDVDSAGGWFQEATLSLFVRN